MLGADGEAETEAMDIEALREQLKKKVGAPACVALLLCVCWTFQRNPSGWGIDAKARRQAPASKHGIAFTASRCDAKQLLRASQCFPADVPSHNCRWRRSNR